jgi:3-oxoacyl-[acyl-carrier protein] reductase
MADGERTSGAGRLAGRRCVITGAARGIGEEIAVTFRREGAEVALLDVDPAVKAVADRLGAAGVEVADLADPVATRTATEALVGALGGIDVLVNNAGILRLAPLLDVTVDEWDEVQNVNVRSMLVTTQVAARAMIAAGRGGKIINMASMAAKRAAAWHAHYSASKAAVVSLTQTTALELGQYGITANSICPGYVLTDMGAETRTDDMIASWCQLSPLGRLAERTDVAAMALFLASTDGDYSTGQAMNVSGGMVMH